MLIMFVVTLRVKDETAKKRKASGGHATIRGGQAVPECKRAQT
jgi:hypothetical protein